MAVVEISIGFISEYRAFNIGLTSGKLIIDTVIMQVVRWNQAQKEDTVRIQRGTLAPQKAEEPQTRHLVHNTIQGHKHPHHCHMYLILVDLWSQRTKE